MPSRFEPPFIPEEMADAHTNCSGCGKALRPDWWTKQVEPYIPIPSTDPQAQGGRWHQVSVGCKCDECDGAGQFPVPQQQLKHPMDLFGDEAYRTEGLNFIVVYSLLGATSGYVRDLSNKLAIAKRKALPSRDPASWHIHTMKMRSGHQRLKHPVYSRISGTATEELLHTSASLIKELGDVGSKSCMTVIYQLGRHGGREQRKVRKLIDRSALLGLVGEAIYRLTGQGFRPQFRFDARSAAGAITGKEGWAEDTYLGSRHFVGHLFLTHSNEIPPPTFEQPGSHPFLELADVHAYFTARAMHARITRRSTDRIPLRDFGNFKYMVLKGDRLLWKQCDDIPEYFLRPVGS